MRSRPNAPGIQANSEGENVDRRKFMKSVAGSTVTLPAAMRAGGNENGVMPAALTSDEGGPADSLGLHESESSRVTRHEMELAEAFLAAISPQQSVHAHSEAWLEDWLGTALPFGFRYDGRENAALLAVWPSQVKDDKDSSGRHRSIVWSAPDGLEVRWQLKQFADFPALEWTLTFQNHGNSDSAILEGIQDLQLLLKHAKTGEAFQIHGAHGGRYKRDDWQAFSQYLPSAMGGDRDYEDGRQMTLGDAYPSSRRHLPFVNIEAPKNRGAIIGVGWTGNWLGHLGVDDQQLTARFGMSNTHFVLHPGESARTAKILLVLWEGKRLHGQNMLRQILHRHYIPKLKGHEQQPMVSVNACFAYKGNGGFLTRANEQNLLPLVEPVSRLGAELFIIDAGWYPGSDWAKWMGNWTYAKERYPEGFRNLAAKFAGAKIDFGVWFAPEVVDETVPLFKQHPEWLSKEPSAYLGLNLKLDLPEAREWFLKQLNELVEHHGMTCYRQDGYNSEANSKEGDSENRRGIGEIKYMTGYYALLDTIRERFPDLIMEASAGAARIDLETIARFHWHQPCETWLHPDWDQNSTCGVSQWLPGGLLIFYSAIADDYAAWSAFGGQLSIAVDPRDSTFSLESARKRVDLYKKVRPILHGDFYPLTPDDPDEAWMGYQFHRADLGNGFAAIFKRSPDSKVIHPVSDAFTMQLRGLDPQARFRIQFQSGKPGKVATGEVLARGIELELGTAPVAELVVYERVG